MSFHHRIATTTVLVASVAALAAPSASAMAVSGRGPVAGPSSTAASHDPAAQWVTNHNATRLLADVRRAVYSRQDKAMITSGPSAPTSTVALKTPSSGFTLGDAGIALAALALALLALAAAFALTRGRTGRGRDPVAVTH